MKPEIAKKWIAALRSGEYKQTRGALREGDSFCCLGVLCNIHAQEHPRLARWEEEPDAYFGRSEVLPYEVVQWAGMSSDDGSTLPNSDTLAEINDSGKKFVTIARLIEKNVSAL